MRPKQATELKTVLLKGTYRKEKAEAQYTCLGTSWELRLRWGKRRAVKTLDRRHRPCWTVALVFFDLLAKRRPSQDARNRMQRAGRSRRTKPPSKAAKPQLKIWTDDD